jgi:HlyD family secretion protein
MMKRVAKLLLAANCLFVFGCGRDATIAPPNTNDDRLQVEVLPLQRSQITKTLEAVGTLLPARGATIVAEVDGVIDYLPETTRRIEYEENGQKRSFPLTLDIGDSIAEGDILVQLDARDAELALEKARAQLDLTQKQLADLLAWRRDEEVRQLAARVEQAVAARDLAEADLARNDQLMSRNAASVAEHDTLRAAAQQARAAVAEAEAALALAQAGPTAEQIAVAKSQLAAAEVDVRKRERELEKTTIRCPYQAVITQRYVGVGDRVTALPRVEIMQIADTRMLFAEVDVPERHLGQVRLGDKVELRAAGVQERVIGSVELMAGDIDLDTRTFRVRIAVDNRSGRMRPGGFVRAWLPIASEENALVVPRTAVSFNEGQPAVFVYEAAGQEPGGPPGRVTRRAVELGIVNREACEIAAGLREGDLVVLTNPALLADGLPVQLAEERTEGTSLPSAHDVSRR